ncbi:carboxymuconolactone decarboxylase family protein [Bordetella genomosp. 12]|uniref:4-carboxymuconolactone decarboxylase n=1 Tax=Bordetella genomosp. 12 TaxID=463035 RepID=A0A261VLZ2_9BORD|nr:carboxymuconolactone decarboxylase family protein [Bordetella genomosp. 12]OZI75144.1 4-carboxymuconolactone decarboxylase [Bordetella genomosp. 12]
MSQSKRRYDETEKFKAGLQVREEVLGKERVKQALWEADAFNAPMQQFATEFCWGAAWSRTGLTRKTRSLLNIGMLTALNRPKELETHVRGALVNGCSVEEIQEALLQAAVYAGVPAGIEGFRTATPVIYAHLKEKAGQ